MAEQQVLIYEYDGSYDGLMTVVFDCFREKTVPCEIRVSGDGEESFYEIRSVVTDPYRAGRVETGIRTKLGPVAEDMVRRGFLYGEGGKETAILRFLKRAFAVGPRAVSMIADREINPLFRMVRAVNNEEQKMIQFIRFSDVGGALVAKITPKHEVLPLLTGHFCSRYRNENFLIYDQTHGQAFAYSGGRRALFEADSLTLPPEAEQGDAFYRELWKSYYRHVAIAERFNPRCRMSHMPKRFWADMPEVEEELLHGFVPPEETFGTAKKDGGYSLKSLPERQRRGLPSGQADETPMPEKEPGFGENSSETKSLSPGKRS